MELTFNEEKHEYLADGKRYPSVSEILKHFGFCPDFSGVSTEYAEKGTAVHKMCELYDKDDLGECPEWLNKYLEAWKNFKKLKPTDILIDIKTGNKYLYHKYQVAAYMILTEENEIMTGERIEERLVSQKWNFAGTVDRIYGNPKQAQIVYLDKDKIDVVENLPECISIFKAMAVVYNAKLKEGLIK